ncbi:glutaminase [Nocardia stercoris]|uniref:glutaminase n=1 Tax=Nocardia stercoris TaxID=2483361 RepID=UPI00131A316D|nr:glutaminase [Nocardia stercoris]
MSFVRDALVEIDRRQAEILDRGIPYTGIAAQTDRSTALFECGWAGVVNGRVEIHVVGETAELWSLQSVSKTEMLARALTHFGMKRVTGELVLFHGSSHFRGTTELRDTNGMPKNPFVNPGAMRVIAALIEHLGGPRAVVDDVLGALNFRLRADTPRFFVDPREAEPVQLAAGGSGNLAVAQELARYDMLFGLEPEVVVETYHTVCATTGTVAATLEAFFHFADGHDVFGRPVLPCEPSWRLLMSSVVALGSYSNAVLDMADRRAGKTGGSGMVVGPTFEGAQGTPPGVFVAASPGLGEDLNPLVAMRAAAMFGELTRTGLFDSRYGMRPGVTAA